VNLLATSTVKFIGISSPTTYTQHPVAQPKMTTTATTMQTAQTTSTARQTTAAFIQSLNDAFDNALNQNPPGSGGGGGGGGGGGNPPANALQPIPQPTDVQAMGKQPESFYGDRTKAEEFIEEVQGNLHLNADVAGLNSPRNKIAFTLTCMKGSEVAGWTKNIGHMVDRLDPAQNVPLLWDHFLQEFDRQYMVSTREDRARKKLSELTMKDYDIDTYIAKFEELSRQASYTIGNQESIQ
jgi:Retrotransposon gag protein